LLVGALTFLPALSLGAALPAEVEADVNRISQMGGTPLVVASSQKVFGVVYLKDILKGGLPDRFKRFRAMGIRTIMITGDHCQRGRSG